MAGWKIGRKGDVPKPNFDAARSRAMNRIIYRIAEPEAKKNANASGGGHPVVRTGRLRSSIRGFVYAGAHSGKIGTRVRYAPALELGATIHRPEIVPRKKKALAFTVGGQTIVRRRVKATTIRIPPYPYMKPAAEKALEAAPEIARLEIEKEFRR